MKMNNTNGIDFGNLSSSDYKYWRMGKREFLAVKLEGFIKTSFGASGGIRWVQGVTGSAQKDSEVASDWLVLVKEGQEVSTLDSIQFRDQANFLAKLVDTPVNAGFNRLQPS